MFGKHTNKSLFRFGSTLSWPKGVYTNALNQILHTCLQTLAIVVLTHNMMLERSSSGTVKLSMQLSVATVALICLVVGRWLAG